ncbi:MAG: hypothetical protein JJT96_20495 [Opitutales bacterium]|nr:hypothetical protein [Opitutales bacterium]
MEIVSARDLGSNFAKLETWLATGEKMKIRRRGKPVAPLSRTIPAAKARSTPIAHTLCRLRHSRMRSRLSEAVRR